MSESAAAAATAEMVVVMVSVMVGGERWSAEPPVGTTRNGREHQPPQPREPARERYVSEGKRGGRMLRRPGRVTARRGRGRRPLHHGRGKRLGSRGNNRHKERIRAFAAVRQPLDARARILLYVAARFIYIYIYIRLVRKVCVYVVARRFCFVQPSGRKGAH